jgi:hypothetical protein
MTRTEVPVVRKQVVVNAPVERAFTGFTERFGDFKPPEHNLLAAAIAETVFEPHAGSRSATASTATRDGRSTWPGTPPWSRAAEMAATTAPE